MHEFSICSLLIKALDHEYDAIQPPPTGLKSVTVMVGELHQIVPDYLLGAFTALTADTRYEGAELKLEFTAITGSCSACEWQGTIQPPLFVCPSCDQVGVDLITGKELFLQSLEVKT
ncbi:MAG: hydrogenase maturation nickel metallochaperone HypA [Planctomycetes bacterium]|nr:hydrogenase maturation nickel metallochaperone HypA [Planctomycetota bacterium]MCP4770230.1 hydrogenase maturation nickel metallochaperone HypA [Planctomycetota bacterium]MCP4860622.1 hydrogenase maturation nickel metallochaperone HypA [Planctomycetota bacterium]